MLRARRDHGREACRGSPGIRHYVFDVEEEFTRDVIDDFVAEYGRGRTPNPCVRCNSNTKFRDLLRRALTLGCDGIATGHYAQLKRAAPGQAPALLRGLHRDKDQSYFLWGLRAEILPRLHFPLGELEKSEVRGHARELALVTADKPESQEICFVPVGHYRSFLETRLPPDHAALTPGLLITTHGEVVGEHRGYAGYTVGQRKGLGGGFKEPFYVLEIRPDTREVVVGRYGELYSSRMSVGELNWLVPDPPREGKHIRAQIRHRAPDVPAALLNVGEETLELEFQTPQRNVSPGQSAAFFDGPVLLGGGRISGSTRPGAPPQ